MTTSLSSLNTSIFTHCFQNKIQTPITEPPTSGPCSSVFLICLYLLFYLPAYWTFRFLKEPMAGYFSFPSKPLHMLFSVLAASDTILPFNLYSSFSSDILLPESLTGNRGYGLIPLQSVCRASCLLSEQHQAGLYGRYLFLSLSDLLSDCKCCHFSSTLYPQILAHGMNSVNTCWVMNQMNNTQI